MKKIIGIAIGFNYGDVIKHSQAESPSVKNLEYAYIVSEKNYLTIGKENTWHIEMSGNPSDYKYDWKLYIRKDLDDDQFEYVTGEKRKANLYLPLL